MSLSASRFKEHFECDDDDDDDDDDEDEDEDEDDDDDEKDSPRGGKKVVDRESAGQSSSPKCPTYPAELVVEVAKVCFISCS